MDVDAKPKGRRRTHRRTVTSASVLSPPPATNPSPFVIFFLFLSLSISLPISLFVPISLFLKLSLLSSAPMAPRFLACFGLGRASSAEPADAGLGPVVVELFSSQGCGASPAAALELSDLVRGGQEGLPPVVPLSFHVDYWDYLGWKDPFACTAWSVRHKAYAESLQLDRLYTPHAVVLGRAHASAADRPALLAALLAAPRFPSPSLRANFQRPSPETLRVALTGQLGSKVDGDGADIMVALYESGLVTDCTKGENKGKLLAEDFVVRRMEKLCHLRDVGAKKRVVGTVVFALWECFNSSKCGVVVFVQASSLHITGAQRIRLPDVL
ncbi:membrane lipoprotein lipid attachment site-like protein, putative (DUF1223) [Wolffia australiana]